MTLEKLKTVRQLAAANPGLLSEGAIRWHIFNAKSNGLEASGALHRQGRKVILDEERYAQWLVSGAATRRAA